MIMIMIPLIIMIIMLIFCPSRFCAVVLLCLFGSTLQPGLKPGLRVELNRHSAYIHDSRTIKMRATRMRRLGDCPSRSKALTADLAVPSCERKLPPLTRRCRLSPPIQRSC
jgi:hypothetical protein